MKGEYNRIWFIYVLGPKLWPKSAWSKVISWKQKLFRTLTHSDIPGSQPCQSHFAVIVFFSGNVCREWLKFQEIPGNLYWYCLLEEFESWRDNWGFNFYNFYFFQNIFDTFTSRVLIHIIFHFCNHFLPFMPNKSVDKSLQYQ